MRKLIATVTPILISYNVSKTNPPYHLTTEEMDRIEKLCDQENETEEEAFDTLLHNLSERLVARFSLQVKAKDLHQHLYQVMWFESKINPSARNKYTSATGILQLLSMYYKKWGYTRSEFANLSRIQQLVYVEKYFSIWLSIKQEKHYTELIDWYCLVLKPSLAGKHKNTVFARRGSNSYRYNKGFDLNKDGVILKREIDEHINKRKTIRPVQFT